MPWLRISQLCLKDIVGVLDGGGHDKAAHRLQQDDHQHQGRVALHQPCTPTQRERLQLLNRLKRCCRSGSGIRCLIDPWINPMNNQNHISESLETIFLG
jgi:hypothetical protein